MTSANEGGAAPIGGGDIELTAASAGANRPRLRWWLVPIIGVLAIVAAIVWAFGGNDEPAALVTATDVTSTAVATISPSTSVAVPVAPNDDENDSTDTETDTTATTAPNNDRPVVPGSTTTVARESTVSPATVPPSTVPPSTVPPSIVVVSDTAGTGASQVSIVDDAITEAVGIDPVPNTSLDAADRTSSSIASTTTTAPLTCDTPTVRLEATSLVDAGQVTVENADGSAGVATLTASGLGVVDGRDAARIDYSADRGASERVFIDLGASRCAVSVDIADLAGDEWNGNAESVHWVGLDAENRTIDEGWFLGPADAPVDLGLRAPIERLLIEAAPYGTTAEGRPTGADREVADNSDFVLVAVIVR